MQQGPPAPEELPVEELRDVSRKLVRELGFMRPTLGDTGLGASAVHAVLEIGRTPGIQARDLADLLRLDKSNTSRQVAKLEAAGLVRRESASGDARSFHLYLTDSGQFLRGDIDRVVTDQVSRALSKLASADRQELIRCLTLYVEALKRVGQEHVD
ncbi:MarR family winged helix-turn-helix transcriptional regulator [Singulisphaera acidiphila]|uniref:Transcriptional regulator n=1 Tax=Singulisphaera acidiphila (strain ATCC BAA-1392 / DSM 18658 / VKM B-2454 / MOB10) TaxID=886293 RepID=L0DPN6_SINAD|nr:MarR family transcriptional regulator [Singulisphaera acidiphila]AGA30646.1 transcriptional regulator [Singulisphaera acidiphila DSM 18658]